MSFLPWQLDLMVCCLPTRLAGGLTHLSSVFAEVAILRTAPSHCIVLVTGSSVLVLSALPSQRDHSWLCKSCLDLGLVLSRCSVKTWWMNRLGSDPSRDLTFQFTDNPVVQFTGTH